MVVVRSRLKTKFGFGTGCSTKSYLTKIDKLRVGRIMETTNQPNSKSEVQAKTLFDKLPSTVNASQFEKIESLPSIFANSLANMPAQAADTANSAMARFFRSQFIKTLGVLKHGCITLIDPIGQVVLGDEQSDLRCTIRIADLKSYTQIAMSGVNGSAQAYIDGLWATDNLSELIRIFVRNRSVLQEMDSGLTRFAQFVYRRWHARNKNTKQGSKRNIAAHYDLGNEFFRLFLDERMMYSSALYLEGDDLQTAADRKLQRICDALELTEKDQVIEIGSGWGGFACYAAQQTGCRVTTVTISQEQFNEAQAKAQRLGLEHLVEVNLQDYRDITGEYDKLVSIEMIEAIGHQYLNTYFNKINHLLKKDGKALIQAIVIDDAEYEGALKRVDFIKRYIFPGGFMPCYSVINDFAAKNRLMLEDLHDMGLSYAQTLRDWRKRFYDQIETISTQGYDKSFQRMWEFYLCYCEGAFDERATSVGQILFRKQANT